MIPVENETSKNAWMDSKTCTKTTGEHTCQRVGYICNSKGFGKGDEFSPGQMTIKLMVGEERHSFSGRLREQEETERHQVDLSVGLNLNCWKH